MTQAALPFDMPEPIGVFTAAPSFVRHRRAKRYIICVQHDGSVRVTIPRGGTLGEARQFVDTRRQWIEVQRARIAKTRAVESPATPAGQLRVLRERAVRELPTRLFELASQLGLSVARVSVRSQRTRWGSCSPKGRISLNWRLIEVPTWVRDYVIVHELMHLKRMDHSPTFWKLVADACPEYLQARRWLLNARRGQAEADAQSPAVT